MTGKQTPNQRKATPTQSAVQSSSASSICKFPPLGVLCKIAMPVSSKETKLSSQHNNAAFDNLTPFPQQMSMQTQVISCLICIHVCRLKKWNWNVIFLMLSVISHKRNFYAELLPYSKPTSQLSYKCKKYTEI